MQPADQPELQSLAKRHPNKLIQGMQKYRPMINFALTFIPLFIHRSKELFFHFIAVEPAEIRRSEGTAIDVLDTT
jgi:hypothetical protein